MNLIKLWDKRGIVAGDRGVCDGSEQNIDVLKIITNLRVLRIEQFRSSRYRKLK